VNQEEVEAFLNSNGFETVDAAGLSHAEQIKLFAGVRHLVAEHGSGVANILFRRGAPLSVLEMFPPGYLSPAFYACSRLVGAFYDRAHGIAQDGQTESYRMSLEILEAKLGSRFCS
jgi:capsular polysaccharide biosynthesis protein